MGWFDRFKPKSSTVLLYLVIRRDYMHIGVFTDKTVADECAKANTGTGPREQVDVWVLEQNKDYSK